EIAFAMRGAGFGRIDAIEPVVRGDFAGDVQDEAAERIALVRVRVHAPVALLEVLVHRGGDVEQGPALIAQMLVLLAIDDVGARGDHVSGSDQGTLDRVLDASDGVCPVCSATVDGSDDLARYRRRSRRIELAGRFSGARYRGFDAC